MTGHTRDLLSLKKKIKTSGAGCNIYGIIMIEPL